MRINQQEQMLSKLQNRELCSRYAQYYGHPPTSKNRLHLIKKILWAIQRDEHGDISEAAKKRALEIADDRDIKERFQQKERPSTKHSSTVTKTIPYQPTKELLPGMVLHRDYQDKSIQVLVLENGYFEWEGNSYKSLSAVARAVTGTRWNGLLFFGLRQNGGAK